MADPNLKKLAEAGDQAAALKLYVYYTDTEPNKMEAAHWLKLAGGGRLAAAGPSAAHPPVDRTVTLEDDRDKSSGLGASLMEKTGKFTEKAKIFSAGAMDSLTQKIKDVQKGEKSPRGGSSGGPNEKKVFGVPLDPHLKEIPIVLSKVLEYFEVKGVKHEGLFRVPGNQVVINLLREKYDSGDHPDLAQTVPDVHAVASLLKLWFRELPEPLLTYDLYDCFIAAAAIPDFAGACHAVKSALKALPPGNYLTTKYLMALLDEVQRESAINKMTPMALSLVFAPNLLRPKTTDKADVAGFKALMQDASYANRLLEMFVQHYEELFENTKSQPAYAHSTPNPTKPIAFNWRPSQMLSGANPQQPVVRAMWDFAGSASGDLPFKKGDIITVRKKIDAGWWEGELNGKTGLFPVPYVLELGGGASASTNAEPPLSQTRPKWGLEDVKAAESKKKERTDNFKKVLDETVVKRVEDSKAKAEAEEVAMKELAALEEEEERQRKEQAEQERRKKQAEKIALRFSLWMKQMAGVPEEELLKQLDVEDENERLQREAEAEVLRSLAPDSPRKKGDKTIAEGGQPKKLKYFAKFDRTKGAANRAPRQERLRDHLQKLTKKHKRPRPPPRKSVKPIPAPDRLPPGYSAPPPDRPPPPTPTPKTAAVAADAKNEVRQSNFTALLQSFKEGGGGSTAAETMNPEADSTDEAVTALDELLKSWGIDERAAPRASTIYAAKPLPPNPKRPTAAAPAATKGTTPQQQPKASAAAAAAVVRQQSMTLGRASAPGGSSGAASVGSSTSKPSAPAPSLSSSMKKSPRGEEEPPARATPTSPQRRGTTALPNPNAPSTAKPAPLHVPSTFSSLLAQVKDSSAAASSAPVSAANDEAIAELDDLLQEDQKQPKSPLSKSKPREKSMAPSAISPRGALPSSSTSAASSSALKPSPSPAASISPQRPSVSTPGETTQNPLSLSASSSTSPQRTKRLDIAAVTPIAKPVSKLPPGAKAVMPGASAAQPPVASPSSASSGSAIGGVSGISPQSVSPRRSTIATPQGISPRRSTIATGGSNISPAPRVVSPAPSSSPVPTPSALRPLSPPPSRSPPAAPVSAAAAASPLGPPPPVPSRPHQQPPVSPQPTPPPSPYQLPSGAPGGPSLTHLALAPSVITAPLCVACQNPLTTGQYVFIDGKGLHRECARCADCAGDASGPQSRFIGEPLRLMCAQCSINFIARLVGAVPLMAPPCVACKRPVQANDSVNACGGIWHAEHFVCRQCRQVLHGGYFDAGGYPLCNNCKPKH